MTIRPGSLALLLQSSMIVAISAACLSSAGCGGDNPSSLAGSVDPEPRKSASPEAKTPPKSQAPR